MGEGGQTGAEQKREFATKQTFVDTPLDKGFPLSKANQFLRNIFKKTNQNKEKPTFGKTNTAPENVIQNLKQN